MNWGNLLQLLKKNRFRFYRVALSLLVGLPVLAMTLWVVTVQPHPRGKLFRSQMALVFGSEILLKEITKPLTMTVFLPEGSAEGQGAEVVLQTYVSNHTLVSYRFVDPERELLKAQQAGYREAGNVLLDYDGRQQLAAQPTVLAINIALHELLKGGARPQ